MNQKFGNQINFINETLPNTHTCDNNYDDKADYDKFSCWEGDDRSCNGGRPILEMYNEKVAAKEDNKG